ncbi:tetratricopeptide repeat protein [bacterium]|nr:tetratricopeptide repeat protein [bacterium]
MSQASTVRSSSPKVNVGQLLSVWLPTILSVVLFLLTAIAFVGVRTHKLTTWQDDKQIALNDNIARGLTGQGLVWAFRTTYLDTYQPLTWVSLMIDASLEKPWAYKVTNVLLHAANGVLLFLLFHRMTSLVWPSFLVAGLFLLHPLHVESVAWASERRDVLSTFFILGSLHGYVWFARTGSLAGYVVMLLLQVASLLSKPTYVTLPLLLLLLDYWPLCRLAQTDPLPSAPVFRKRSLSVLGAEKILPLLISLAGGVVFYSVQEMSSAVLRAEFSPLVRLGNAMVAYATYLRKTIAPIDLSFFYPYPQGGHDLGTVALSAGLVILLTVGAFLLIKRAPFVLAGWLWYLILLLPTAGFVQIGFQAYADRFTYLPLVGLFVVLIWGGAWLSENRKQERPGIIGVAVVLLLVCMGLSWWQVSTWATTRTMAKHALDLNPNNPVALVQMGTTYAFDAEWAEAEKLYSKAIEIDPKNFSGLLSLGGVSLSRADTQEAKKRFLAVLELDPNNEKAQLELGLMALGDGNFDEAIDRIKKSLGRVGSSRVGWLALGVAFVKRGEQNDWPTAKKCFQRVLSMGTDEGVVYQKEANRALELLDRMENRDPTAENRFGILFNWPPAVSGARLMADQAIYLYSRKRIDYKEAIDRIEASLKLWPNNIEARYNLGLIAAGNKRGEQAAAAFDRILQLDPKNRDVLKIVEASKATSNSTAPAAPIPQ